jgi:hypothetical protein
MKFASVHESGPAGPEDKMMTIRKILLAGLVAVGAASAFAGPASAQYYYDPGPRYYEPRQRYAPQPRYYEPERQYYRDPGYGRGGYVDRDTALRNARALKEAQKRAIKEGRPVPGVYNAPAPRYAQPAPRYVQPVPPSAPNSGYYGQTPGYRGQTGPSNEEIYRNRN